MPKIRTPPKLYFSKEPFEKVVDPRVIQVFELKQYKQRTKGWYKARNKCITASSASSTMLQSEDSCGAYLDYYNLRDSFKIEPTKTCSHRETQMEFILSKCGLGPKFSGNEHTRWGQKYEQVVSNIYSQINQVDILEFGLIRHPTVKILGASPDGIGTNASMLEIKCPPCRQVKPYPPLYYWIQMQLQLICTNLERCDYFDAHFVEYLIPQDWEKDARQWENDNPDVNHHIYGIILSYESIEDESKIEEESDESDGSDLESDDDCDEMELSTDQVDVESVEKQETQKDEPPEKKYIYAPPNIVKVDEFLDWCKQFDTVDDEKEITPIYYKLHEYYISKAEVNHEWFKKNLPSMSAVWDQVKHGRTKEGRAKLVQYLENKQNALNDKREKRRIKNKRDANLEMYIDLDLSGAQQDTYQKTNKSWYIHEKCLL